MQSSQAQTATSSPSSSPGGVLSSQELGSCMYSTVLYIGTITTTPTRCQASFRRWLCHETSQVHLCGGKERSELLEGHQVDLNKADFFNRFSCTLSRIFQDCFQAYIAFSCMRCSNVQNSTARFDQRPFFGTSARLATLSFICTCAPVFVNLTPTAVC